MDDCWFKEFVDKTALSKLWIPRDDYALVIPLWKLAALVDILGRDNSFLPRLIEDAASPVSELANF